jgi:hypothetical protein
LLTRVVTPREYEAIMVGLREYRDEEARAFADKTGQKTVGGGTIRNS